MTSYTVVGVYDDNHQPYADHKVADTPEEAAKLCLMDSTEGDLRILCVFEGDHTDLLPQSDGVDGYDSGYTAEDFDLNSDDDEGETA